MIKKPEIRQLKYERKPEFREMDEWELLNNYVYYKRRIVRVLDGGFVDKYNAYSKWLEEIKDIARRRKIYHKLEDHYYNIVQEERMVAWRK